MSIIHDFHQEQQNKNTEDENMRRITTTDRLIRSDVKSVANTLDVNPSLPTTLQMLLRSMFAAVCIYFTLNFVSKRAKKQNVTASLLWPTYILESNESRPIPNKCVSKCDLKSMIIRFGGFHMEISFPGSIGHLMTGSGLKKSSLMWSMQAMLLTICWLGKQFQRAVQGHVLVDAALNTLLVDNTYDIALPSAWNTDDVCLIDNMHRYDWWRNKQWPFASRYRSKWRRSQWEYQTNWATAEEIWHNLQHTRCERSKGTFWRNNVICNVNWASIYCNSLKKNQK